MQQLSICNKGLRISREYHEELRDQMGWIVLYIWQIVY